MDYKNSRMIGDDCIRVPFNCDQGFEEYFLVYVGKSPYEKERHLDKVVCARGPLTEEEHKKCKKTEVNSCWKDNLKESKSKITKTKKKKDE
ncbi:MAG: hypothetical protein KatS3mg068_1366 [Candidatus Sericytochromatia bacterium]|nr:MAG: hypothetical protein KatS3mg068_1366 [Candidatus Sericytochromatia bacterium]